MSEYKAEDFIIDSEIVRSIEYGKKMAEDKAFVVELLNKAKTCVGLTHREASVLLNIEDPDLLQEMFKSAKEIKEKIYGRRIVIFAPLYVSNYCINNCQYCGYKHSNDSISRKKLNIEELKEEVKILESLGHKRLALEVGEDPVNTPIEYVLDCIKNIYSIKFENGSIRRINVNIAATTVEEYKMLKDAEIGTYILFQETYHKETYERIHPQGPKHNYNYHTTAMDRAKEAGIDDVGIGVLYGLYEYKYDTIAMLMHAEHLEASTGVGPHTVSVPRLRPAENVSLKDYPYLVTDEHFKKLVAVLRLAVPYAGMLLSTREDIKFREEVLALGVSQVSAGSCTGVGGYADEYSGHISDEKPQFEIGDHRSPKEIIESLCESGYIPSYCTACYREGRTGDRFMRLAKSGQIHNVCQPNALLTLKEFILDYGDENIKKIVEETIRKGLEEIPNEKSREATKEKLDRIEKGERDLRF
ncbi:[FeFe] hydrogenase H-cluster radical SAM maturase HydG [Clostridium estertheticum]|uniref:[FeFe] hydrogenase H-cluster radical SAM maturase HydG n=1 Tax=Clostridium estertheticum TaxID=238834 RepID=UPI0013E9869C|nr:[FeFe] hydrogenase H-cluster radical SAM maturase HydG [Clostridium estertheticum]MBZ9685327.1 [FeFe] hydrogenase H-cluster radical SAM maturase HydG [Clostridium estertheticum]